MLRSQVRYDCERYELRALGRYIMIVCVLCVYIAYIDATIRSRRRSDNGAGDMRLHIASTKHGLT